MAGFKRFSKSMPTTRWAAAAAEASRAMRERTREERMMTQGRRRMGQETRRKMMDKKMKKDTRCHGGGDAGDRRRIL